MKQTCISRTLCSLFLCMPLFCLAATGTWTSSVCGEISYNTQEAPSPLKDYSGRYMTVVYLENLGFEKIGQNTNAEDVRWLLSQGYRVIELDYKHHAKAIAPAINMDIIQINDALNTGSFAGCTNCSSIRSYILFEGYRIARDVSYFLDDPKIYNWPDNYTQGDSLYMDIVYPANTSVKVPVILSFSYSNSYANYDGNSGKMTDKNRHQRLFLGYTLAMFDDSFLEGAPANGMAWAIADHPKYCDWGQGKPAGGPNKAYGSFETNPDAVQKVKSAVRTLRAKGESLGLSGRIGIYGFSRGSTAGSLAVGDKQVTAFENAGLYTSVSDDIQAAALGSGVFDYTIIYDKKDDGDKNLESRCPMVWGELKDNQEKWASMGATYLVESSASAPVLFFYNTTDEGYYQEQIAHFEKLLKSKNIPTTSVVDYASGHAVPKDTASLQQLYTFFRQYLIVSNHLPANTQNNRSIVLFPNPNQGELHICFRLNQSGSFRIQCYDEKGDLIYRSEKNPYTSGEQRKIIHIGKNLPKGIYHLQVISDKGEKLVQRFVMA